MLIRASVTVGAMLSTVALVVSAVVVVPAALVALTLMLRLVASMEPDVMEYVAVQVLPPFDVATTAPPPNWLKSMVTPVIPALLSPPAVLFQVAVTVSPIL